MKETHNAQRKNFRSRLHLVCGLQTRKNRRENAESVYICQQMGVLNVTYRKTISSDSYFGVHLFNEVGVRGGPRLWLSENLYQLLYEMENSRSGDLHVFKSFIRY